MSTTDTIIDTVAAQAVPSDLIERPGALPYLTVADAQAAIDWYTAHLGARLRGEPITMDDGTIGHAELEIGNGVIYLAAAFPEMGLTGPLDGQVSVSLMLPVADTDATLDATRRGGATVQREPYEAHGTRGATIIDPFGHRWMLTGPSTQAPSTFTRIQHGDIGFLSVNTADAARARAFYGAVLGWRFADDERHVSTVDRPLIVFETDGPATLFCGYAVDDIADTRDHIVAAGGSITREPYAHNGRMTLDAIDDAGVEFCAYEPSSDESRPEQHPLDIGDMSYLTVHTRDSARFREFYGSVFGWRYTAGRMADGWEVSGAHPQVGIAGGSDSEVAVAMWNVADIFAAVERVREAGGQVVTEPEEQAYGIMALCADDQGARFYLGQLS